MGHWTPDAVADAFKEAMRTLRNMPAAGCFPAGARSAMPTPLQSLRDWLPEFGSKTFLDDLKHLHERIADERNRVRIPPTSAQITAMDEVTHRWRFLVRDERHLLALAAWAAGERTGRTAKRMHVDRRTVWLWRKLAVAEIAHNLNNGAKP